MAKNKDEFPLLKIMRDVFGPHPIITKLKLFFDNEIIKALWFNTADGNIYNEC